MKIEIEIPDEKVENLSDEALSELRRQSEALTGNVLDESARIETSRRTPETNSEVTASIVKEAAVYSRRFSFPKKKKLGTKLVQCIAFVSTLIAGSLLDTEKFSETSHVVWFIISLFIAIGTTVYLIFNNESYE